MKTISPNHPTRRRKKPKAPRVIIHPPEQASAHDTDRAAVAGGKLLRNLLKIAKVDGSSELLESYEAILGCRSLEGLCSSNFVQRKRMLREMSAASMQLFRDPAVEVALQIEQVATASGARPVIDVPGAKKQSRVYQRSGVESLSSLVLVPHPDLNDPLGFGFRVEVRTLMFGQGITSVLSQVQRGRNDVQTTVSLVDKTIKKDFDAALKSVLDPSCFNDAQARSAANDLNIVDWDKSSKRARRALVAIQCLSMLPMGKQFSAQGQGKQLIEPVLHAAKLRLKEDSKFEKTSIHRDGMPHFWFAELRRLGFAHMWVPFVKLH